MTLSTDTVTALREAVLAIPGVPELLGSYKGEPSVHTRRPVPAEAGYPMVVIPSAPAAEANQDGLVSRRPVLSRDILVYGLQPDQLRDVDRLADLIKEHFHRNRFSFALEAWHVVDVVASGPTPAPVDDKKQVGRHVLLSIRLNAR